MKLISLTEMASSLGLAPETTRLLAIRGSIPAYRVAGKWLFETAEVKLSLRYKPATSPEAE